MKKENSLARIKLWLDVPYYIKLAGTEKKLDESIISSGISEEDLKDRFCTTYDPNLVFSGSTYSELKFTSEKTTHKMVRNKLIKESKTEFHYEKAFNYSVQLTRAIINSKNKLLAAHGYTLYTSSFSPPNDIYVSFEEGFSLYIPLEAYLKKDYKEVNKRILEGLNNTIDCTKKLIAGKVKSGEVFKRVVASDLYINILKITPDENI